ncbi:unnamed protein product, partial [Closterium sp. Naga37s-1]
MYDMTGTIIRLPPIGSPNESSTSEQVLAEAAVEERLTEPVPGNNYDASPEAASESVPGNLDTATEQRGEDSLEQGDTSASDAVDTSSPTDQVNEITANPETGMSAANSTGDYVECHAVEVISANQMTTADVVESAHVETIAPVQTAEKQKLSHEELKARIMGYGNTSVLMKRQQARADVFRHVELANIAAGVQTAAGGAKITTSSSSSAEGRGSEGGFIGEAGSISRKPALWRFGSTGQQAIAATTASDGVGHEGVSQKTALNNMPSLQMIVAAPVAAFVELGSKMSGAMVDLGSALRKHQENGAQVAEMSELDKKKLQEQEVRRQDAYKNASASLFKTSHHQERLSTPNLQVLPPDIENPEDVLHLDQAADVEVGDAKGLGSGAGCNVMFGVKEGDEKDGDDFGKGKEATEASGDGVSEVRRPCELDGNEGMGGGSYACDHSTALSGSLSIDLSKEMKGEHSSEIVVGARSSDGSSKSSEQQSNHSHSRDSAGSSSSTEHVKEKWPLATRTSTESISMGTRRPRVILDDHWWKTKLVGEEPGRRLVAAQLAREAMLMRGGSGNVSRLEGRIGGLEAPTPLASRSNSGVPLAIRKGAITTALHEEGTDVAQGSNADVSKPEGEGGDIPDGADGAPHGLAEKCVTDPPVVAADGASACMDTLEHAGGDHVIGLHGAQGNYSVGKGSATTLGKVEVTLPSTVNQADVTARQHPCQTAIANQDNCVSKTEHKTPVKVVPPPVDKKLQSGFDGLMRAVESLATMSVSRSPRAKPWASSNRGTDKGATRQSAQPSSPVLTYDGGITSQGKRQTEPRQAAAGVTRQAAMFPATSFSNNYQSSSTGHRLPAASPEHTEEFAHKAGVLSLQQQAAWLWSSAQHMASRGTRASSASSDGDSQARGSGVERDRLSGRASDKPHPFPPVQPPSASPARSPLPSSRLVLCASSRRGGSRPAPRGFSAREAMRGGVDSEGRQYASADEMWRQEAGERAVSAGEGKSEEGAMEAETGGKKREWYDKGVKYWEVRAASPPPSPLSRLPHFSQLHFPLASHPCAVYLKGGVEASVDGVLGGYGAVSSTDAAGSAAFLHEVYGAQLDAARSQGRPLVALDCGAGIGRVTKEFLLHVFNEVDLVEPVRHFIDAARDHLASPPSSAASPAASHRAVNFFCCPLQEFSPDAGRYDVVWVQWCIGHLTDADLIAFLHRCLAGLRPGGIIVLKENTCQKGFVLDKADSSVTRSDAYFRDLFKQANLQLLKSK